MLEIGAIISDFWHPHRSIYFSEIKQNLIEKGVDKKQVISTSDLVIDYLQISDAVEKNGIEIGGPSSIFGPIYDRCLSCDDVNFSSNTVWWMEDDTNNYYFEDKKIGKVYIADATDMSCIENDKYDFLLSSNNLEHIANPIKALKEFVRVVNINGKVIVAVPDKEQTFDHNREYTSFEHMLNDYTNNIEENDLSHLKEIINEHDYSMDPQCGGKENFIKRAKKNYENRCLHHHVFCEESLKKMFEYVGMQVKIIEKIGINYWIIGEKVA